MESKNMIVHLEDGLIQHPYPNVKKLPIFAKPTPRKRYRKFNDKKMIIHSFIFQLELIFLIM